MNEKSGKISSAELDKKRRSFVERCREAGLKVTPQRMAVYTELLKRSDHPSAEVLYKRVRRKVPGISLDTVNRTLLKLAEIGAAFVVEGSGDAKRYDAGLHDHQHFRCLKCKRIVDFHHEAFDNLKLPSGISRKFKVLRKTVYLEGICDRCR